MNNYNIYKKQNAQISHLINISFQHMYTHLNINDVTNNVSRLTLIKKHLLFIKTSGGLERFRHKFIFLKYRAEFILFVTFIIYIHYKHSNV